MITIEIPGRDTLNIDCLVLDYNGTIAEDGALIPGVADKILALKEKLEIHVLTADTYGTVRKQCENLDILIDTFPRAGAGECKKEIVCDLKNNGKHVMCVGNGYNDIPMSDLADLAVAVIEHEGAYAGLISHTDILVTSILDAFDLLLRPNRMKATLRS